MRRSRLVLVVVGGAVMGAALFALVQRPPSEDEVRRSARALVPAGLTVTSSESGNIGYVLDKGPFFSSVDATGPQGMTELEAAVRATAESAGWPLPEMEDLPGARVLRYERGDLSARVSLRRTEAGDFSGPEGPRTFSVSVKANSPGRLAPGLFGAAVGAAVAALGVAVDRRRAGRARDRVVKHQRA